MQEFDVAPFGVTGLETALSSVLTDLYHGEKWTLAEIVKVMSARPAEILNLGSSFGCLEEGAEANLIVVDVNREWTVKSEEFLSKSKNSCFTGTKFKGKVIATVCAGKLWKF